LEYNPKDITMKTGLIIPCYNEATRLNKDAFINFIQTNDEYHLCFVNDGSTDNTITLLESIKNEVPSKVSIIDVKKNAGKAAAVRVGMRYLFSRQEIALMGYIDADLSTDFKDFKNLVHTIKKNKNLSVIFGSRSKGNNTIKRDFFRAFFSGLIKLLVGFILGLPIHDTQCGAKIFRRNCIATVYTTPFLCKWLFDVEIFIRLKRHFGKKEIMNKILEQPLMRWEHVEDSKLGAKDAFQIPFKLISIWFFYSVMNAYKGNVDPIPHISFTAIQTNDIAV